MFHSFCRNQHKALHLDEITALSMSGFTILSLGNKVVIHVIILNCAKQCERHIWMYKLIHSPVKFNLLETFFKKKKKKTAFHGRLFNCNKKTCEKRKAASVCADLTLSLRDWTKLWPPSHINHIAWTGNIIGRQNRETGRTGRQL